MYCAESMYVLKCIQGLEEGRRDYWVPWNWVIDYCKLPCGRWELSQCLLQGLGCLFSLPPKYSENAQLLWLPVSWVSFKSSSEDIHRNAVADVQRSLGPRMASLCPLIFRHHLQLEGATSITVANGLMEKVILELSLPPLLFLVQWQSGTKRSNKTVNPISSCDMNNCVIGISGCLYCNKLSLSNSLRTWVEIIKSIISQITP